MTRPTRPGEPPSPDYYPPESGRDRDAPSARPTFTPRSHAPSPTFTSHRDEFRSGHRRGGDQGDGRQGAQRRGEDRPRPTFAPHGGYFRPPDARRGANRTRVLEVPEVPEARRSGSRPRTDSQPNLARSSQVMALGTLVSRVTGFLRTFVLLYAIGTGALADAYNNSNALPQTVYYLMLGGVFTSVVVPLLVKAAKNDPDRGEAYAERIFTLGVIALLTVTVVGTLLADPLVHLYAGNLGSSPTAMAEHQQMVLLAHFSMPQIFFFGMDSLLGAILNTRGRFGANMWTPVINNVVVVTIVGIYIGTVGLHKTPLTVSPFGVKLLGLGALLGILIQSIALFPVLRRAGFSMHLRWDFRRSEIGEIRRMAGWMLGYVGSQWAANLTSARCSACSHPAWCRSC
jgi:hypothetical protein